MNLTIKQKIFTGYIVMITFTLLVGVYAVFSLKQLNSITDEVFYTYGTAAEKLARLNDSILAQDLFEKRYLLLRQVDAENHFWSRNTEFKVTLVDMHRNTLWPEDVLDALAAAHEQYTALFKKEAALLKNGAEAEASRMSSQELRENYSRIQIMLKDIDLRLKDQQRVQTTKANSLSQRAFLITAVLSGCSVLFGILFASLLTAHLTAAISRLKEAASMISTGEFDKVPEFGGTDELADLAVSFREMSARLKELEAISLDANPLTKLPGNLAIEKELLTRLNETRQFSFCLIDLDNFKAFNDRYSYARGSELILWLAELLVKIKKEYGADEDFLGHIGGDDFILICDPARVQTICSKIIEEFDANVIQHYDPEDAKRGYIISIDRHDKPAIFGIMTISIAVVNTDRTLIQEPREVTQKVSELKQYAKTFAKSIYIMDRRRSH